MNVTLNYGILLDIRMNIKRVGERWIDSNYRHVLLLDLTPNQLVFISDLRIPVASDVPITLGFQLSSREGAAIMQSTGSLKWKEKCRQDGYYQYGVALESTITRLYSLMNSSEKAFYRQSDYDSYESHDTYSGIGHTLDKFI